jgi:hypothetical protein
MFAALNRSTSPAFFHGYLRGGGTLHTIVGEPAKRRLLIGIGGDAAALEQDMLDISFDRWIEVRICRYRILKANWAEYPSPLNGPRDVKRESRNRPLIRP